MRKWGSTKWGEEESSAGTSGAVIASQQFGCHMNSVPLNYRKGSGASTDAGSTAISQLTAWVVPVDITLKWIEITTFERSFTVDPVVEIFEGTEVTSEVSVTVDSITLFPVTGSFQVIPLGDIAIPAGSVLTVRQTAGDTLEFSAATVYYV